MGHPTNLSNDGTSYVSTYFVMSGYLDLGPLWQVSNGVGQNGLS